MLSLIKTNELKGIIVSRGYSQHEIAKKLGMTPKTFYLKMKKGIFDSDEISEMIKILDIEDPVNIFFAQKVT